MTTLADLTKKLTPDEVKAALYQLLADAGLPTTSWKPGAVVRTIIAVVATALSGLTELLVAITESGFLELAKGDWLTLVARYVYGVERDTGGFATGELTFANPTGFSYSGGPDELIAISPSTGKTYRNTTPYSIPNGSSGVVIPFSAVELGTGSTAAPGDITALVTPLSGVTLTNAQPFVGIDRETDDELRLRCYEKVGALSPNGPRDAYAFVARSAKLNGVTIGVTRVRTIADGIGGVDVYVADASGTVSGTVGDLTTPLGVIDDQIQRLCAPLAITARVHSATAKTIDVTYELWIKRTSLSEATITEAISRNLTTWMGTRPIGGHDVGGVPRVFRRAIEAVIGTTEGIEDVVDVATTLPAADVGIAATEAPVLGTVTVTAINFIDEDVL